MNTAKRRGAFISYSRKDKEFALEFAGELKSAGYSVWFDQLDIPTGSRWDDEVEKALHEYEIFLIILTPASVSSENVKDEIGYAIDHGKRIMPVLLEECDIPLRLRRFQYVDFTKMEFDEGVKRAKQLLQALINERSTPVVKINSEQETPKTPRKETTFKSPLPNENRHFRRRWIVGGVGILALTAFLGAFGAMMIFNGFRFPLVTGPQSQIPPTVTRTIKATPTHTSIPPTRTSIATLTATQPPTPTQVPVAPEIIMQNDGTIGNSLGNQWRFFTDSPRITVKVNLTEPANTCPVKVWIVNEANQIIFTETISSGIQDYTALVDLEPRKNYTVVVGGNNRSSSTAGCSGSEVYNFKIEVWSGEL